MERVNCVSRTLESLTKRKLCETKRWFKDEKSAKETVAKTKHAYKCMFCDGYHTKRKTT